MTDTNDKNPQAPQTPSTTNGPTFMINTPAPSQPTPDAEESEADNSDPNITKQPLDPNNPQAKNDGTKEPVAENTKTEAKA